MTNSLTVNINGVSIGGLSFAYYYDNGLTASSRILNDFGIGPQYFNVSINSNGVSKKYSNEIK